MKYLVSSIVTLYNPIISRLVDIRYNNKLTKLVQGIVKRDTFDNIGGSIVNSVKDLVGIEGGDESLIEDLNIDVSGYLFLTRFINYEY